MDFQSHDNITKAPAPFWQAHSSATWSRHCHAVPAVVLQAGNSLSCKYGNICDLLSLRAEVAFGTTMGLSLITPVPLQTTSFLLESVPSCSSYCHGHHSCFSVLPIFTAAQIYTLSNPACLPAPYKDLNLLRWNFADIHWEYYAQFW